MYCVCNKISFKEVISLITDYGFNLEELRSYGICGNKCELCMPLLRKELNITMTPDEIRKYR